MDEQGVNGLDTQTHTEAPRMGPHATNIKVEFESGPSAAAWARNALLPLDDRVDAVVLEDVRLLVSELVTNSVRHAGTGPGDHVRLDVVVEDDTLLVQVADSGTGFDPRPREAPMTKAGGWGLYLV